jgi:hypothetical protein
MIHYSVMEKLLNSYSGGNIIGGREGVNIIGGREGVNVVRGREGGNVVGGREGVNICAPGKDGKPLCADDSVIKGYVEVIKKEGIVVATDLRANTKSHATIADAIKQATKCKDEACVLDNRKVRAVIGDSKAEQQKKDNLLQEGPRDSNAWLDNSNIDEFLRLLKNHFDGSNGRPKLYPVEFQMRDFVKTNGDLSKIDLYNDVKAKGYTHLACVLNTDYSTGSGIHWFCILCDLQGASSVNNTKNAAAYPYTIEYFNSSGRKPLPEIDTWMSLKQAELEEASDHPVEEVHVNVFAHQMQNSECGVYCLHYIWNRLEGKPYSLWRKQRFTDAEIKEWRKKIFRPKDK